MQKRLRQAHVAAPDRSQHVLAHVPQPVSLSVFPRTRLGTANVKLALMIAWTSAQAAAQAQERSSRRAAFATWEQPQLFSGEVRAGFRSLRRPRFATAVLALAQQQWQLRCAIDSDGNGYNIYAT